MEFDNAFDTLFEYHVMCLFLSVLPCLPNYLSRIRNDDMAEFLEIDMLTFWVIFPLLFCQRQGGGGGWGLASG